MPRGSPCCCSMWTAAQRPAHPDPPRLAPSRPLQVGQRDDSRFFLALGAAVLLPAALGLGLAAGTGYLDHLQSALY